MEYWALYSNDLGWETGEAPVGIIVVQRIHAPDWSSMEYHAMHWSHRQKAWVYDPEGNGRIIGDVDEYGERRRSVTRIEAEQITPAITKGERLPDEDTIQWIFQWKGAPPQFEDTPDR